MKPGSASRLSTLVGVFTLVSLAGVSAVCAEPSQPGSATAGLVTIPAPPVLPRTHELGDEFDGRHLFFDTRFAWQRATSIVFDSQWQTVAGSPGDVLPPSRSGSEKLSSEAGARRLSLTSEYDNRNGGRTILRTIADGSGLVSTRFDQASATAANPARTCIRLTLDESASLQRSLAQCKYVPKRAAASLR